jgi:hypothetical protein
VSEFFCHTVDFLHGHSVKKGIFIILIVAGTQLFASDEQLITVNNYTLDAGVFIIHATDAGKPIDLLCNQDSPYCSALKPGQYWMVDWTVPVIAYQGPYTCKEVDLFVSTRKGEKGRKLGEYCLVESRDQ